MTTHPPTSFTDALNRRWDLALNVTNVRAVKDTCHVDVMKLVDPQQLGALLDDPATLIDAWYVILADQINAAGIDDVDFGKSINGDALETGIDAFVAAVIDFFPKRQRDALAKVWEKIKQAESKGADRALAMIAAGKMDSLIERELERAENELEATLQSYGPPSTNAPASSASTPAP